MRVWNKIKIFDIVSNRDVEVAGGLAASTASICAPHWLVTTCITPSFPMRNYLINLFLSLAQNKYLKNIVKGKW